MSRRPLLLICLLSPALARSAEPLTPVLPAAMAKAFDEQQRLDTLVATIDCECDSFWKANKVVPAGPASDGEFARRLYLDLVGRVPTVHEARAFLADRSPRKHAELAKRLAESPASSAHLARTLAALWVPQGLNNPNIAFTIGSVGDWVRGRLNARASYADIVRAMLTVPTAGANQFSRENNSPVGFVQANEFKPENVAAAASRLFMGVKLECAQCHDHPFQRYKRDQFWELAAFFAEVQPIFARVADPELKRTIKIPDVSKVVKAKFFDGPEPTWDDGRSPRGVFADWLLASDNPFFAKHAANRFWAHLMGVGLIDPIDEPGDDNPPSIPAVEKALAGAFRDANYDVRFLLRAITMSKAYRLSSVQSDPSQSDPRQFARFNVRPMTGDQLFDSIAAATGTGGQSVNDEERFFNPSLDETNRGVFVREFSSAEKPLDSRMSILQALALMNGRLVERMTSDEASDVLAAVADAPFLSTASKVETLFLATVGRIPTAKEAEKFASFVDRGGAVNDKRKALGDVFWSLLNSTEFYLNH